MKNKIENLGKVAVTIEEGYWDIKKPYDKLTIVEREGTGTTFISRKPVPPGTSILNRKYWIKFSKWSDIPYKITQKFGDSEELAISQKTLTDKFSDVETEIREGDDALDRRLRVVEVHEHIMVDGGELEVATDYDLEHPESPRQEAAVPTVRAILDASDDEPHLNSTKRFINSDNLAKMYGYYLDNPEFIYLLLDSEYRIILGVRINGDVVFAAGVPKQIIEYVSEIIKPFEELFHLGDNPEFVDVKLDSEEKILEGTKTDGTKVIGGNLEVLESFNINGITYSVVSNPEWLKAVVDFENKVICGIRVDGTFCVVDIDFLDSSNKIKEVLNHFDVKDNPEFLSVELDEDKKVLGGRKTDGTKFENVGLDVGGAVIKGMNDPEARLEIKTDSADKIISYRKEDGTLVENVGIETNHLELTKQGMTDFQQALKDAGFQPGGSGDYTDKPSMEIPEPRCAIINITNPNGSATWPTTKTANYKYNMEFYDGSGNYFRKEIIFNAQGASTMNFEKKNATIDLCNNNGWDDDDTFKVKFGDWRAFDSFHLKAYYLDKFRGAGVIAYKLYEQIDRLKPMSSDKPWKRAFINLSEITDTTTDEDTNISKLDISYDNGAKCLPDGFPCVIYLDGEFHGIYSLNIKKHRDNYNMKKDDAKHILLDGNAVPYYTPNWTGFEIRNPKKLVYAEPQIALDGNPTYKYDADDAGEHEIAGNSDGSMTYDSWVDGTAYNLNKVIEHNGHYFINTVEGNIKEPIITDKNKDDNPDYKNKTKCGWINCTLTVKVKHNIMKLHNNMETLYNEIHDASQKKEFFESFMDVEGFIDYAAFSLPTDNYDSINHNWLIATWDGGEKWFLNVWDLDIIFGGSTTGCISYPAEFCLYSGDGYPMANIFNSNAIMQFVRNYYWSDVEARYKVFRDAKIIETKHIMDMFKDWLLRYGDKNYKAEFDKWNMCVANRARIFNDGWELGDITHYHSLVNYDPNRTYSAGEECRDGNGNFLVVRANRTIQGVKPVIQDGQYDNIYRLEKWLDNRISLEDEYLHYNN